jgi:proteasome lid subunit RPN8/RPN11
MPSTMRRRSGKPLTVTDVVAAGRNMLRAGTPTNRREIQERMAAIDAVMACLTGPNYASDFYRQMGREWSRLAAVLSGGSSRSIPATAGWAARSSADEYAAAEAAWQRDPARLELARQRQIPASWRLPERPRAKVEPPSIRLDADTAPRVKVFVTSSAYESISAEAIRWGSEKETGGWLVGRRAFGWHRQRTVTSATVAARVRKAGKVTLDADEFTRMDAQLQEMRDRAGNLRGIGDWHTHPTGEGRPSEADLRCQALDLATIGDHNVSFTSLIVTRNARTDSWARPQITAWITRYARSSFGEQMVCEPAIVSLR